MQERAIHPTAIVSEQAELGNNIAIGPYAIVGDHVSIGDNCRIDAHAIIEPHVRMGVNNRVHSHAIIGGLPQDIGFDQSLPSWVDIGDNNCFRESCVISRASFKNESTVIGSNCYFMNHTHVGHDCVLGDNNILATGAAIGGHVHTDDRVFFGGGAMVHQFCRIGSYSMIAGLIAVRKDIIPYTLVGGSPVRHYRLNVVGLRRAGITGARYKALAAAYRCLREKKPLSDIPETPETGYLKQWLAAETKRGILGFINAAKSGSEEDQAR